MGLSAPTLIEDQMPHVQRQPHHEMFIVNIQFNFIDS